MRDLCLRIYLFTKPKTLTMPLYPSLNIVEATLLGMPLLVNSWSLRATARWYNITFMTSFIPLNRASLSSATNDIIYISMIHYIVSAILHHNIYR